MGQIRDAANSAFSDGPSSNPNMPQKSLIRWLFRLIEDIIYGMPQGYQVAYETRAQLYADLNWPAGSIGRVFGDSNSAYIGVYKKSGSSGSGSWSKIGNLPVGDIAGLQSQADELEDTKADKAAFDALLSDVEELEDTKADLSLVTTVGNRAVLPLASSAGTATAYTATLATAPSEIINGMVFSWIPHVASGDDPTLQINAFTAANILMADGSAIKAGDLRGSVRYLLSVVSGQFRVISAAEVTAALAAAGVSAMPGMSPRRTKAVIETAVSFIPLTVTGDSTPDALVATVPDALSGITLTNGSLLVFVPTAANTGAATITVKGVVRNLRDADGLSLGAGVLQAGVPVAAIVTAANQARIAGPSQDTWSLAGGPLVNGADLNTIVKPGLYYANPAHTYVNAPDGTAGQAWVMDVRAPKAGLDPLRRWVIQTAWIFTAMGSPRSRRIDGLTPGGTYAWTIIGGGYAGSFTGVDMSTFISPGKYAIGMVGTTDKPEGFAGTSGLLDVQPYATYVIQTLRYPLEPVTGWMRTVRPGSPPTVYPWYRLKAGGAGGTSYADTLAVFLGDSIAANSDYPARVGDRLGLAEAINCAFGGTRMGMGGALEPLSIISIANAIASGNWSAQTAFAETYFVDTGIDVRPKVARLASIDWGTVKYLVIHTAANDWANGIPIGTPADSGTTTICGSSNTALNTILTAYPHLRVLLVTPHWRARQVGGDGKDSDSFPNSISGEYLIQVVDGLKGVANRWHIPCLDMYRDLGLNLLTYAVYLRDQTIDGVHPYGAVGAQLFADRVSAGFESVF